MLSVPATTASSFVATYTENGHVTKDTLPPENKPRPGNYSWFLATGPAVRLDTLADLVDDRKATLVGRGNFDDGKCAEDNTRGRTPQVCKSIVSLSAGAGTAGETRQLVWLWNFPKVDGVVEMYTSCADLSFTGGGDTIAATKTTLVPANAQATPTKRTQVNPLVDAGSVQP